jgi:hypothetical protein
VLFERNTYEDALNRSSSLPRWRPQFNSQCQVTRGSLFVWLMAGAGFVLREKYCWLFAGGWFIVREKYCWLEADKPVEVLGTAGSEALTPAANKLLMQLQVQGLLRWSRQRLWNVKTKMVFGL